MNLKKVLEDVSFTLMSLSVMDYEIIEANKGDDSVMCAIHNLMDELNAVICNLEEENDGN